MNKITIDFDDVNIMNLGSGASLYHIPFLFTSEIFENFEFGFGYHFERLGFVLDQPQPLDRVKKLDRF